MKNLAVGRFIFQKGTRADLIESALILLDGEVAMETDTQLMKVGDGKTEYKALPYLNRGAKGDKGEKGEKGDTGTSLSVLGTVSSTNELPKTAKDGDGYMIDGDLYIAKNNKFTNVGRIQGPKGDRGLKGDKGNTGDRGIQGIKGDKGDRGAQGFKGEKGDPLKFEELTEEQKRDIANKVIIEEIAKHYVKDDRVTDNIEDRDLTKIVTLAAIKNIEKELNNEIKTNLKSLEALESYISGVEENKVDKVDGKGLSTNDFTNDFKNTIKELTISNIPSPDFNNVSKQGIYNGDFSSNCPNGSGKYTLIVCPTDSSSQHRTNYMFQIAIRDNSDSTPYFRQRRGSSTWGKWYKFSTNDYTDSDKKKVNAIPSNPKYTDTIYSEASTSSDGLMSASDKKKLDGLTFEKFSEKNKDDSGGASFFKFGRICLAAIWVDLKNESGLSRQEVVKTPDSCKPVNFEFFGSARTSKGNNHTLSISNDAIYVETNGQTIHEILCGSIIFITES